MLADHLVMFADEPTAFAALPQHTVQGDSGTIWNSSYAMPVGVTVPNPSGTLDDSGNVMRDPVPDYFAWIALPALDTAIQALPGNACRLIADRDAYNSGNPSWLLYRAPDLTDAIFDVATVSPIFAGSNYPFVAP